ncbi:hypothetical protein H9P43_004168 [Blastocladiella emersonii ATCC 22665]|nr:hypothetical protein H9P43_004168 [Blastocladiella emersonii ATCC 22665]
MTSQPTAATTTATATTPTSAPPRPPQHWPAFLTAGLAHVDYWACSLAGIRAGRFPNSMSLQIVHIDTLHAALLARHLALSYTEANVEAIFVMPDGAAYAIETDVWVTPGAQRAAREGYGTRFKVLPPRDLLVAYGRVMRALHAGQHWAAIVAMLGLLPSGPSLADLCASPVYVLDIARCLTEMHEFFAKIDTLFLVADFGSAGHKRNRPRSLFRATARTPARGVFVYNAQAHGTVPRCLDLITVAYEFDKSFTIESTVVDMSKPLLTCVNFVAAAQTRGIKAVKCRVNGTPGFTSTTMYPESDEVFDRLGLNVPIGVVSDSINVSTVVRYLVSSAAGNTLHAGIFFLDKDCMWMFLPGHVSPDNPHCRPVPVPLPDYAEDGHGNTPSPLLLMDLYGEDVIKHVEIVEMYFATPVSLWEAAGYTS